MCTFATALLTAVLVAAPASALNPTGFPTWLMSATPTGGLPNGPSWDGRIALDERNASVVAFTSTATDLVPGDPNGRVSDVFAVPRASPFAGNGTAWRAAPTVLISRGRGGAGANGPSWGSSVSGDVHHSPRCVAFLSDASNLVPGDTNGATDAFLYRWSRHIGQGRITRVSVNSVGRQALGPTTSVVVDGDCSHVAFISAARNLALTHTSNPKWRGSVSGRASGQPAAYVRTLTRFETSHGGQVGLTLLASRSGSRALSCGTTSLALSRGHKRVVAYACGGMVRTTMLDLHRDAYRLRTTLVAPGDHPALDAAGDQVAYETSGGNISWAVAVGSGWRRTPITSGGGSFGPSLTAPGIWISYESDRTRTARNPDRNGVRDAYLYTVHDGATNVVSFATDGRAMARDVHRVRMSAQGNYLLFDTTDISAASSRPLSAGYLAPPPFPGDTLSPATQVYMHWMGPK